MDGAYTFLSRFVEVSAEHRIGCIATLAADPWLDSVGPGIICCRNESDSGSTSIGNANGTFSSPSQIDELMGSVRFYVTKMVRFNWDQELSYRMQRFGPDFG